ncbi:LapA family protein [Deinococcus psychrotolerans]|uniref:LapA family protein n=1 Tax=Deinococcus psychrotolerans TaxID=2489213 RepID=A0A3G8YDK4_9DEIO|nr:LapA family protein [Deinococcus psychrotolerans]AZI42940.1 LapA family protein [Deinococcus psychrotolerans]
MRLLLLIVVLVLHLVFGLLNINSLMFTHDINMGFAVYTGPLGLILLITSALVAVLAYVAASFSSLRREADTAKLLRDLDSVRQSLDSQEASRFAQLQAALDKRFAGLDTQLTQSRSLPPASALLTKDDGVSNGQLKQDLGALSAFLRRKLGD